MTRLGEAFLATPDLFPARIAGEEWGSGSFRVDLPGGPYVVSGLSESQRASLEERYGREALSSAGGMTVMIYRAPEEEFLTVDTRGWEYALDFEGDAVAGLNLMARFDLERGRAAIWTSVTDRAAFWGVVENVLRPLVARRLLLAGGLLVHASAVDLDGRGLLFAAPSGGGKSTMAKMALRAGYPVLSDDMVAVERFGGGYEVVSLPFTGDLSRSEISGSRVALGALVSLEKGTSETVVPISRAEASALLARTAPYVNRDARLTELLLQRAGEITASIATVRLVFRRDGDVWKELARPWN